MKIKDYINKKITEYPIIYLKEDYETSKFSVLHHIFIVLGNGCKWAYTKSPNKGGYLTDPKYYKKHDEYIRKYDQPYGKEKHELDSRMFTEDVYELSVLDNNGYPKPDYSKPSRLYFSSNLKDIDVNYIDGEINDSLRLKVMIETEISDRNQNYNELITDKVNKIINPNNDIKFILEKIDKKFDTKWNKTQNNPYPNFQKKYSCFWEIEPHLIKDDWKEEGIKHLKYWQIYFNDPERYKNYAYYPNDRNNNDLISRIESNYKNKENWVKKVCEDYQCPIFNGQNYQDMVDYRWNDHLNKVKEFLKETIERLEI
jgi:hypothetical protein